MEKVINFLLKKEVYGLLIIIVVAIVLNKLLKKVIAKILNKGKNSAEVKKRNTLVLLFENIIKYIIMFLALVFILELYGVDTKSLVAGLGVMGVVIGLALQDFLKDIIMGVTILGENYFSVGDIVTIGSFTGKVVEFGLRTTKLKNEAGDTYILANRNIASLVNVEPKKEDLIVEVISQENEKIKDMEILINDVIKDVIKNTSADEKTEYMGIIKYDMSNVIYGIKLSCPLKDREMVRRYTYESLKEHREKLNK